MLFLLILTVTSVGIYLKFFSSNEDPLDSLTEFFADKKWCTEEESPDVSVRPFTIQISDDDISDLHRRLGNTKFPSTSLVDSNNTLGMNTETMKGIVKYWRDEYSWKEQEKNLNQYPHFKTAIEGLDIHFVHVIPQNVPAGITPKPLLLLHGWPGSFYEFYKTIPMLTDPLNHAGNESDVFELIIPSIPGYGFSDAPQVKGFSMPHCSRIFHKLMFRLEHKQYYVQGGDWGSCVAMFLAKLYPSCILGIHTNMCVGNRSFYSYLKLIVGNINPYLFYHPQEAKALYPITKIFTTFWKSFGYFHLQATKPDTVSYALSDSPVGLASYILDKFVAWTNLEFQERADLTSLLNYFSKDELLTNIMIYWWSGNIGSSLRFYFENLNLDLKTASNLMKIKVCVPAGFVMYPHELFGVSKDFVETHYANLVHMTYMDEGGHFAAFQCPKAFVQDVRVFIQKVEISKKKDKMLDEVAKQETAAKAMPSHLDVLQAKE